MNRIVLVIALGVVTTEVSAQSARPRPPIEVHEASITDLQAAMTAGRTTAVELVEAYLARIAAYDQRGPALNAMIRLNRNARADARRLDEERRQGRVRGPLHGIPIILKDNFDTSDLPTSGGSLALANHRTPDDAFVVRKLREAGAIVLGKSNMHELAAGITTVSSLGGQTRNPYDPRRCPGGSSGGTGAAIAASFAAVGWGSDTCGSIRIPSAFGSLAGLRPTQGLVSRSGVMPLSHTQDIAGPLARTVRDLAIALDVSVGADSADSATRVLAGRPVPRFTDSLGADALRGARIGILVNYFTDADGEILDTVRAAIRAMKAAGADTVRVDIAGFDSLLAGTSVINYEHKHDMIDYLAKSPGERVKSIADILASGLESSALEARFKVADSLGTRDSEPYRRALARQAAIRTRIAALMDSLQLDALVYPTMRRKPVFVGDAQLGTTCALSAQTGLPALSIPAGFTGDGLPVGIELLGRAFGDVRLVSIGYAFEQLESKRRAPYSTPPLVNGAAPGILAFSANAVAPTGSARVRFTFDRITSTLGYEVGVRSATPDAVQAVVVRRHDAGGLARVVQRLAGPGTTAASGRVTLGPVDRAALLNGQLFLALVTADTGPIESRIVVAQRAPSDTPTVTQPRLGTRGAPIIERDGLRFKDLDRSGTVDPYENWRLTPEARARDLVARMTLEEKAGAMMHGTARSVGPMSVAGVGTEYDSAANRALIDRAKVTSMITRLGGEPASLAAASNTLQEIAERTRLGIPITISTDPRHHFQYVIGASVTAGQFSQWPEPLGFASLGDTALVRRFGDIARQEYRAVGIHMALSPQADLATEPRWSRINGTFGEDADLARRLVRGYVEGFQHGARGTDTAGVLTVVKHWVGYGAANEGFDSHSFYGRFATFPGGNLEYHVKPFLGAFAANVAGVMPTYSVLRGATWAGRPIEPVGAGFNRQLLTDMLRKQYGFRGVILTDWAVTNDCNARCREGVPAGERPSFADVAMPWGVEDLPMRARFVRSVESGVDQFGGTERADLLVEAVRARELAEARLDSSVRRILVQKFALGLFENAYVDPADASRRVGTDAFRAAALDAQRRALVLLENQAGLLPLKKGASGPLRVYLHGVAPDAAANEGWTIVTDAAQADVAIMRLTAPFETLHPGYMFGAMQHEGSLAFRDGDPDYEAFKRVSAAVPTIVTVYLDRPAILTPLKERARAVIANFGVSDAALVDVLSGRAKPTGKLPFELPASMEAVVAQRADVPHDSSRPLYPFGFGRRY